MPWLPSPWNGVACYFAAEALDGSQDTTLVWTVLFLAILGIGEIALDFYRDRSLRAWHTVTSITLFVGGLGRCGSGSLRPSGTAA